MDRHLESPHTLSPVKKRVFRILLALGLPLVVLLATEGILRSVHYGYPSSFLIPTGRKPGELRENPLFGRRFFPAAMARAPLPLLVEEAKPANSLRVLVLGESAARGEPEPAYSFSRILQVLLQEQFPTKQVEVLNAAVTAINSHAILPIVRDCARLRPDVCVIYMGNNEVMGPFGPGTVFGDSVANLRLLRASLELKSWRTGQLLDQLRASFSRTAEPRSWEGLEMFMQKTMHPQDERLESVYRSFEENLRDILSVCRSISSQTLLCTVGVNLKDSSPFASIHPPGFSASSSRRFVSLMDAAEKKVAATNMLDAIQLLREAARIDPDYAEVPYQLGLALLAIDKKEEARTELQLACDLDALRFRTDSRLNQVIRKVGGQEQSRADLVDVAALLANQNASGAPGDEEFFEYVHLNFDGNYRVAVALADRVAQQVSSAPAGTSRAWLSKEACGERLGFTDWNRLEIAKSLRARLSQLPFKTQSTGPRHDRALRDEIARLQAARRPEMFDTLAGQYQAAIARAPRDWTLQDQYARLAAGFNRIPEASNAWSQVIHMAPHHFLAWFRLGALLNQKSTVAAAEPFLRQAIALRPEIAEAHLELGNSYATRKRYPEAEHCYQEAIRLRPTSPDARTAWGNMLVSQGNLPEAIKQFRAILENNPNHLNSRVSIAQLMLKTEDFAGAIPHIQHVVAQHPENLPTRLMLVDAYYGTHDTNAALAELEKLVQSHGSSLEARNRLAIELANRSRLQDAEAQFTEMVQLRPEDAATRFNLAKVCFDQRKWDESLQQLKEVLRLKPGHRAATNLLARVLKERPAPEQKPQ
ncbi:MAG: tetratricopeptide repeat protein [Verrucomicrobia bacterium]|nr:tetratricopeptide repeat protein [Verrucomicrobiota bacterium]